MYGERLVVTEELCLEQWEIPAFSLLSLAWKHLAVHAVMYVLDILLYLCMA